MVGRGSERPLPERTVGAGAQQSRRPRSVRTDQGGGRRLRRLDGSYAGRFQVNEMDAAWVADRMALPMAPMVGARASLARPVSRVVETLQSCAYSPPTLNQPWHFT